MLRHIVLLQWQDAVPTDERTAVLDDLRELVAARPGVAAAVVAADLGLTPGARDAALVVDFADEAAWRSYQDSASHKAFVAEQLAPRLAGRSVIQVPVTGHG